MKIKRQIKLLVAFVVSLAIQYFCLRQFIVTSDLLNSIITFLSILFGFYIASLAIFVSSKYVSDLYKVVDSEKKNTTLLHTLIDNYKLGLVMNLFSIAYFIIIQFTINQSGNGKIILSSNYLLIPFLSILVINFIYSYRMLNDLLHVIIQEAKNNQR